MSNTAKTPAIPATKATSQAVSSSVKDSGKVRMGAGMIKYTVKDTGRVRMGAGMIRF